MLGISALQTSEFYGNKHPPKRLGSAHPRNAPYQSFQGCDKPFVIAAGNDKLWKEVTKIVELPYLYKDKRFETQEQRALNQDSLKSILNETFSKMPSNYWIEKCIKKGVPCAPINNFGEILNDPHVRDMGIIGDLELPNEVETKYVGYPINLSDFDFKIYAPPPELGEHNKEVLKEWL